VENAIKDPLREAEKFSEKQEKSKRVLNEIIENKPAPPFYTPPAPITIPKKSLIPSSDYWFDNDEPPLPPADWIHESNLSLEDNSNSDWCHCCFLKYTSESEKKKHLEGKEHQKRTDIKEKVSQGLLKSGDFCLYCFSKIQEKMQEDAHLKSSSHKLQVKRHIEYLTYIQDHPPMSASYQSLTSNTATPSASLKKIKPSKTFTNIFPICENEQIHLMNQTFYSLDVDIEIFRKAGIKIFKYSNKNKANCLLNGSTSNLKYVGNLLEGLRESFVNEDNASASDIPVGQRLSEINSATCLNLNQAILSDNQMEIEKFLKVNYDVFAKSLDLAFDSISKASFSGNN
jgi:hypothetical protein